MNLVQLAEVAGVSKETVRRVAKSLYPSKLKRGVKAFFADNECKEIIEVVRKKNMVSFNENLPAEIKNQQTQLVEQQTQLVEVDYESIGKMIGMAVTAALSPIVDRLDKLSMRKALPEPIKEDFYSLVAYCKINGIKVNRSDLALHGMALKKIAESKGIKLKKIPDERWGHVNSYPSKILDAHFSS